MNPQADNDTDSLKRRLNQLSPSRSSGQLNVPPRDGTPNIDDIDESAFDPDADLQKAAASVRPVQVAPARQATQSPVILPAAPAPLPEPAPAPAPPAPTGQATPAARPVNPVPVAAALPPVAPKPVVQPSAPAVPIAPPQNIMPPSSPPAVPQPVAPIHATTIPPSIPPMPVTPVEHAPQPFVQPAATALAPTSAPTPQPAPAPAPEPAPLTPKPAATAPAQATAVSYEPEPETSAVGIASPYPSAPGVHIDKTLVERIDETPQQNSKDIESLIERNHRLHRLKGFASFLVFCVGVVIAAFLINQFIFQSYYVDGTSMTPTLQNDDRLIIDKVEKTVSNLQGKPYVPQRGQIVVLDSSLVGLNGKGEQLIKRVIGLPGDTVIIRDGSVTIKNHDHQDGFDVGKELGLTNLQPTYVDSPQEWTIEPGHVFVMGDNRGEGGSYDSRAFGPIESDKIVGRLWARILPFDKAKVF